MMAEFQDLLKSYITSNSEGVRELADKFEVAISTVHRWASGTARPHPHIMQQIIDYLQSRHQAG